MNNLDDPIIAQLKERINAIAEMCNERVRPFDPDSGVRSVRLCNELVKPYIDYMCEYVATRPKFAFPVAWCNSSEGLVQVDFLD